MSKNREVEFLILCLKFYLNSNAGSGRELVQLLILTQNLGSFINFRKLKSILALYAISCMEL